MIVSAGQLHSSAQLLELIAASTLGLQELASTKAHVLVCPIDEVLNLCSRCGWVEVDVAGNLRPSHRGQVLRGLSDFQERLRHQLKDIVTSMQPSWSKMLMHGRRELARFAPPDVTQCFKEAGLMTSEVSDGMVKWWDEIGSLARGFRSASAMVVGRAGEKLSLAYERARTGKDAYWQSIETSFSGYDVLSVIASDELTPLEIEVKASQMRLKEAFLHVSANEWESAEQSRAYQFHLWHLSEQPQLAIIGVEEMRHHIPTNQSEGTWESVKVPFRAFLPSFKLVSPAAQLDGLDHLA